MKEYSFFPLERNRYFYGKLLTVRDFEAEQTYQGAKHRLINRLVHGAGVVCGLGVTRADDTTLLVGSGMALDYLGREIVVEQPLVRKLEMLPGYDSVIGREDAYLCLSYFEEEREPVNAVSGGDANAQHNMVREGYSLYLTHEAPEYRALLEAHGKENVHIVYATEELTLVFYCAQAVCAGDTFVAGMLIVKNAATPSVRFTLEGESGIVEGENNRVSMHYSESPEEKRNVVEVEFRLKAQSLSDMSALLFPNGAELTLDLGAHTYKNILEMGTQIMLLPDQTEFMAYKRKQDDLNNHLRGREIPIYLAKLELIEATERVFMSALTSLPFMQVIDSNVQSQMQLNRRMKVSTSVKSLEFWEKPDVHASYEQESDALHLAFGIPSPELYDYKTSHGYVDITMTGGLKVNGRYYSDEIPHDLGAGNVEVRLAVECAEDSQAHLFGNSEIFRAKTSPVKTPWVEAGAVVYPERGTMRIGIWLHDVVAGNVVRVHYYAQKPERDTKRLLEERRMSIRVMPEVTRVSRREQARLKAVVHGSDDKGVIWSVKDDGGGSIDQNGIYRAPEELGTYEILAKARADERVVASAYVIVEE